MTIGPVQLVVLGFRHPNFQGEVIAELERLRQNDAVRVIDALAVYKDRTGEIEGEEGARAGAEAGAEAAARGTRVFSDETAWDVLDDIPNDSAAALLLLEHHWAVPLRDAIARAGGFRVSDGFISPFDLVEIGLISAEEAKELHEMETAAAAS